MARLPRLTLAGEVHHVILRGNNRQPVFLDGDDRSAFLLLLAEHAKREKVQVHAYVLMDNHLHLLMTPEQDSSMAKCMQGVGRSYVRRFNQKHGRTGTLWEGRYRSTVLEAQPRKMVVAATCAWTSPPDSRAIERVMASTSVVPASRPAA